MLRALNDDTTSLYIRDTLNIIERTERRYMFIKKYSYLVSMLNKEDMKYWLMMMILDVDEICAVDVVSVCC